MNVPNLAIGEYRLLEVDNKPSPQIFTSTSLLAALPQEIEMTKLVEVTHFRTERFSLTKGELVAALRKKYGEETIFEEGTIDMVCHQGTGGFADETQVYFKADQA